MHTTESSAEQTDEPETSYNHPHQQNYQNLQNNHYKAPTMQQPPPQPKKIQIESKNYKIPLESR